jgi:hypothetical protein
MGLDKSCADGGGCFVGARRSAGWSLRLRLHSGLRQSGTGRWPGLLRTAEAVPFRVVVG